MDPAVVDGVRTALLGGAAGAAGAGGSSGSGARSGGARLTAAVAAQRVLGSGGVLGVAREVAAQIVGAGPLDLRPCRPPRSG